MSLAKIAKQLQKNCKKVARFWFLMQGKNQNLEIMVLTHK